MKTLLLAALALVIQDQPGPSSASLAPGTVTVAPMAETAGPAEVRRVFEEAVQAALVDAGFLALPGGGKGRYVARLEVTRAARGAVAAEGRASGTETRVGNWGAGLNVPLQSAGARIRTLVVTRLTVELWLRDGGAPVWRGSAVTVQPDGTPRDAPEAVAKKLAGAVMRSFPEARGEAVSVP